MGNLQSGQLRALDLGARSWTLVLVILAACGFPQLAPLSSGDDAATDAAGDAVAPCESCALFAVRPEVAQAGESLTLEGVFAPGLVIQFPGGSMATTTVLGPNRATVIVPPDATAGVLSGSIGSTPLGALPFRATSFTPVLSTFTTRYEQSNGARVFPALQKARASAAAVVLGTNLYVIGGYQTEFTGLGSVERATINADGTVGKFSIVANLQLATPRDSFSMVTIGSWLYVIGGSGGGALATIERAPISADGSLGTFSPMENIALQTARWSHTSVVVGAYVYVIGGENGPGSYLSSIERAPIVDGELGTFVTMPDVVLLGARSHHTSIVIGSRLCVLGGYGPNPGQVGTAVDCSTIGPDGDIGMFTHTGTLTAARESHSTIVLGTTVFVIGGRSGALLGVEQAQILPDGSLTAFTVLSTAPVNHARNATAIVGNSLYLIGDAATGQSSTSLVRLSLDGGGKISSATADSISLPSPLESHTSTVLGNTLYLIGGDDGTFTAGSFSNRVVTAPISPDGTLGALTTSVSTLPSAITAQTAAVTGSYLYLIGGIDGTGHPVGTLMRAPIAQDGSLGAFVTSGTIGARFGHCSVAAGQYVYVIGGRNVSNALLASVEQFPIASDSSLGTSVILPNGLTTARAGHSCVVLGDFLYVIGGESGGVLASVERAGINSDGTLTAFTTLPISLTSGKVSLAVFAIGSVLYAMGGSSGTATLATADRATIASDGTLGQFTLDSTILTIGRMRHTVVVIGNDLHAVGGYNGVGLSSVERAPLP